jgi:predicted RNase H-like HicB family nuclease
MKTYLIVIEKAQGNYGAFSPDVLGCVTSGDTVDETVALMREALQGHLEMMVECGEEIPTPQPIEEHLASYRAEGVDLNSPEFVLAFIPVEDVVPVHIAE